MSGEDKRPTAFVIQSFDGGKFDRRYLETIRPGIVKGASAARRNFGRPANNPED